MSITFSPLHLLLPMFVLDAEVALGDYVGLAALGGIGQVSDESVADNESFAAYQLGSRLLFYPIERFESLQLGAEVLWVHVASDDLSGGEVQGSGEGLAVGPLLGYKLITRGCFTFFVEGGVAYAALRGETRSDTETSEEEDSRFLPLLNANIGWSF